MYSFRLFKSKDSALDALCLTIAASVAVTMGFGFRDTPTNIPPVDAGQPPARSAVEGGFHAYDDIVMQQAEENIIVMFGETHAAVLKGEAPPVQDSDYVMSLLPALKRRGYAYLALEVKKDPPAGTHSGDVIRFCADYGSGRLLPPGRYPHAKPGWIELVKTAMDLEYVIEFIDVHTVPLDSTRDREMFRNVTDIFRRDRSAKILVYIGANHVQKCVVSDLPPLRHKTLGLLLDEYTGGKNFSLYIGYLPVRPKNCDLVISCD